MPKLTDAERDTHRALYGSYILSVMEGGGLHVCLLHVSVGGMQGNELSAAWYVRNNVSG